MCHWVSLSYFHRSKRCVQHHGPLWAWADPGSWIRLEHAQSHEWNRKLCILLSNTLPEQDQPGQTEQVRQQWYFWKSVASLNKNAAMNKTFFNVSSMYLKYKHFNSSGNPVFFFLSECLHSLCSMEPMTLLFLLSLPQSSLSFSTRCLWRFRSFCFLELTTLRWSLTSWHQTGASTTQFTAVLKQSTENFWDNLLTSHNIINHQNNVSSSVISTDIPIHFVPFHNNDLKCSDCNWSDQSAIFHLMFQFTCPIIKGKS